MQLKCRKVRGLKGNMGEGAELARGGVKKYREIRGGVGLSGVARLLGG